MHLILHLQRPEHGAEGREAEIALAQRELARHRQFTLAEPVAHRHGEGAHLAAHRALHPGQHGVSFGGRAGRRGPLQPQRAQHDLGVVPGVQQRLAEHVAPRALLRALGHVRWKVGTGLLRAQLRLVDRKRGNIEVHLEAAVHDVGRHVEGAAQVMRGDYVVVTGAGERAATINRYGEE
jgi:hypothetical protein